MQTFLRSIYKNKVCVLCWCPYGRCVINDLEWQHDFELFLHFDIKSVNETSKKKNYW